MYRFKQRQKESINTEILILLYNFWDAKEKTGTLIEIILVRS